ncbi:MAG: 1-acyl-sn-glycerol-3-phosphate acyltransferase [Lachnospiraceae bacterium]|nr:1-acyl-sn-glycerol-3-phosphate acyltransferase [Lachnospiraceae bacterium]
MIRLFLILLFIAVFLIGTIPVLLIEWLIGKVRPEWKSKSSLAIVSWVFRGITFLCGTKVIVLGEERIPKDTPVLYVGNHRSYFDIVLTYPRVPRATGYVAKKEMNKIPLLRVWMRYLHCIFLDRSNIRKGLKSILKAVEYVKSGISICIFPEGTRNKVADTFLPFHEGSFKIAEKGKVPIIPLTIVNSAAIFEDHFPRVRKATVVIEYGEPIIWEQLSDADRKKPGAYVQGIIEDTYFRNQKAYF